MPNTLCAVSPLAIAVGLVPAAIGVALSPLAIIELILVLLSRRARVNGVVFVVTAVVTTLVVVAIGAFAVGAATDESSDEPSIVKGVVLLIVGVLVVALAARNWQRRRDTSVPKVFDSIADMGPGAVSLLAFSAIALNPKVAVIVLAAGAQAGASDEPARTIAAALVIFTMLASSPLLAALGYVIVRGEHARAQLDSVRSWLMDHTRVILAVVLGILGVVLVAQGWRAIAA